MSNSSWANHHRMYYEHNLERLSKEHGGEYILIIDGNAPLFFRTKSELENEHAKYHGGWGPTTFSRRIPKYAEYIKMAELKEKFRFSNRNYLERILDAPPRPINEIKIGAEA